MIIIFIRVVIIYALVLLVIRLMGKRQLGEMQPFELVITIMIAEIAAVPLEDVTIPLLNGIIPIVTLFFLEAVISILNLKSEKIRKFICGKPSIIMEKGVLKESEMKKLRIDINDLSEGLRTKDYPKLHELEYIILETNGELSVIPKEKKTLPITVIADGKRNIDNMSKYNISEKWLKEQLKKNNINSDKEVFWAYVDDNKLYLHRKENN